MKLKLIAVAVSACFAMMAQAQQPADGASKPVNRADVKAEAKAARKAGEIPVGEADKAAPAAKSTKARADVKAEAKAARKAGEIPVSEADKAAPAKK